MTQNQNLNQYSDSTRISDSDVGLNYEIHSVAKYVRDIQLKDYFNPRGFQNHIGIDQFTQNEEPIYKQLVKQKNLHIRKVQTIGLVALLLGSTLALKNNFENPFKVEFNEQFIEQITKTTNDYME